MPTPERLRAAWQQPGSSSTSRRWQQQQQLGSHNSSSSSINSSSRKQCGNKQLVQTCISVMCACAADSLPQLRYGLPQLQLLRVGRTACSPTCTSPHCCWDFPCPGCTAAGPPSRVRSSAPAAAQSCRLDSATAALHRAAVHYGTHSANGQTLDCACLPTQWSGNP